MALVGKGFLLLGACKRRSLCWKPLKSVCGVHLGERVVPLHFKKVGKIESCAGKPVLWDMGGCTS